MSNNLEFLIPLAIFLPFALIVKVISDNNVRRKLIEKGMVDEKIKYLFWKKYTTHPVSNLKWGFILIGIGLALLLGQILPDSVDESAVFGIMFIFAGIGFLAYYRIAKNVVEDKNDQD
ncbi:MAG: DUF6249 domain-containing protein [Candidatus Zhuqueibacterota bacterium]